ncbi:hypothetical protein [Pyrococcus yayanosii]|uniref:hypothetical protein n=1 Tax=Pyrococcus yayanosii TaxID=1008460 RepID=UPI000690DE75|nr:hypothetical protein [Pyrococcus yayanosii]
MIRWFLVTLLLIPPVLAEEVPNVLKLTTMETATAVIALYEVGHYEGALEGCEWLLVIKTPQSSWGAAFGERPSLSILPWP